EAKSLEEELQKTSAEIQKLTARLRAAQARLAELQRTRPSVFFQPLGEGAAMPPTAMTRNRGRITSAANNPAMGTMNAGGAYWPATNNDQEQRLRTVEKKLDMLIEELRAMHPDRPDQTERAEPRLQRP